MKYQARFDSEDFLLFIAYKSNIVLYLTSIWQLAELPDAVYLSAWEDLSHTFKRYVHVLLMVSQRPRFLSGFGLISCNLDTFSKVIERMMRLVLHLCQLYFDLHFRL